jgi:hypothetical protein
MIIKNAQYKKDEVIGIKHITVTIDGKVSSVPLDPDNRHYAEILAQVKAGTLTIKDAD